MVVVTEAFAALARRIAEAEGAPGLPVLVLPYPFEGRPADEVRAIATGAYPDLLRLLGVTSP